MGRTRSHAFCLIAALLLTACSQGAVEQKVVSPADSSTNASIPSSPLGANDFLVRHSETAIVVAKTSRRLELYRHGTLIRTFPVVFGPRPAGPKRYEGDLRTPEGLYHVSSKRSHERWKYFIAIDYPTEYDRSVYDAELSAGRIPLLAGRHPGIGAGIGIHGNDRPLDQASGNGWTRGCVAMQNDDISILYELVEVGTPVVFLP